MNAIRRLVRNALTLVAVVVSGTCFANFDDQAVDGPRWACWYSPASLTVQCLLSQVPSSGLEQRAAEVASSINRKLPALVKTILGSPEQLAGSRIAIPMISIPYEMDFVRMLAKSVMCGARPDCSVSFDPNRDGLAPVRAAAIESGASEAEVMAEVMAQGFAIAQTENTAGRGSKRKRNALRMPVEPNQMADTDIAMADIR